MEDNKSLKASFHQGRTAGGNNHRHNRRDFDTSLAEHIDPERTKNNIYYNYVDGVYTDKEKNEKMTDREVIEKYYNDTYTEALEAQNQRYIKTGHRGRARTMDQVINNAKTKPDELILQIGNKYQKISPELFAQCVDDYLKKFSEKYPAIKVVTAAIHFDETTDHAHVGMVYNSIDAEGHTKWEQSRCLEQMGIERPDPSSPSSRYNNVKMTFTRDCLAMWYDVVKSHGIEIDTVPILNEDGSKPKHMSTQEYRYNQQQKEMEQNKATIKEQKQEIEQNSETIKEQQENIKGLDEVYTAEMQGITEQVQDADEEAKKKIEQIQQELAENLEQIQQESQERIEQVHREEEEQIREVIEEAQRQVTEVEEKREQLDEIKHDMNQEYREAREDHEKRMANFKDTGKRAGKFVIVDADKYDLMIRDISLREYDKKSIKRDREENRKQMDLIAAGKYELDRRNNALNILQVGGQSMKQIADHYIETGESPFLSQIVEPVRRIVREQEQDGPER